MPDLTPTAEGTKAATVSALTDGTGISAITGSKFLKDFVLDFLMTAAAALTAVNVLDIDSALAAPAVVETAIAGALIRVIFRTVLRWASS